jgi:copper chaperone
MTTSLTRTYKVPDISCDHCVAAITEQVSPLDGVSALNIDLQAKTVTVEGGNDEAIIAAIDEAGFDVKS